MIKRIIAYIKEPSLQVYIAVIFFVILSVSSISIISFTYSRNSKSTIKLANIFFEEVSRINIEGIADLIQHAENLAVIASSLVYKASDLSLDSQHLIRYMMSVIGNNPDIYGLYFGSEDGSFIAAVNLFAADQTRFMFSPNQPLPPESVYVLMKIDRKQANPREVWDYLDKNLKIVATESRPISEVHQKIVNPQLRPWYQNALKANGEPFWSDVYIYDPLQVKGITVSKEIKNDEGQMIAVIGVDISLKLFANYIAKQPIGENGKAYILNSAGKVIIPTSGSWPIAEKAYQRYQKVNRSDFIFKFQNVRYLGSAHIFPSTTKHKWMILLVAPMSDFFADSIRTKYEVLWISLGILWAALLIIIYFSGRISKPIVLLANETDKIRDLHFESKVSVASRISEIKLLNSSILALRKAIQSFSRYVPSDVVRELMDKQGEITVGGEKKNVVVFFSDIEGFTSILEGLSAEALRPLLAEYFDLLFKIIIERKGMIDKYIGDSIMAIWGAPKDTPNPEIEACRAALQCRDALVILNENRQKAGMPLFKTRFGISRGEAIVGNFGTLERLNYTVMGDCVNIASRLQVANKIYHTQILISENVNELVKYTFQTRFVDVVELKGKKQKINIYELIGLNPQASSEERG